MKKLLSLLLSVCMVVTLIPVVSFAAETSDVPQDTEPVVQMESQGDDALSAPDQEQPSAEETIPEEDVTSEGEGDLTEKEPSSEPEVQMQEDTVDLAVTNGWTTDGQGHWRYYDNGAMVANQFFEVTRGNWYRFDGNGYMQVGGPYSIGGSKYLFDSTGQPPNVPAGSLGVMKTGWQQVAGVGRCYFNPSGTTPDSFGGRLGAMLTGWQSIGGQKYYLMPSNGAMKTGWLYLNNATYYFNTSTGVMATGFQTISGKKYYFNPSSGNMRKGWLTLGNDKYYFDTSSGVMKAGWQTISGHRYYFNTASGKMARGFATINGARYYFNTSNGRMVKGLQKINGNLYFFNTSNGRMKTGFVTYNKKKYYFQPKNGVAKIGLSTIKGNRYYFQSNGVMLTNRAVKVSGKLYYFFKNGKGCKKKGWFKGSDGGKRYSLGKGRVQTGKKKIGGIWYLFNKKTGIAKTLGDSFDMSIQSKSSRTNYLIAINRGSYQVRVYQGGKNDWTRIRKMDCAVGSSSQPTPAGTFYTSSRKQVTRYNLNGTHVRFWYHTVFLSSSNRGIHSGLYYDGGPNDGQAYDVSLRNRSSQGSVRVAIGNAQWIYNNVPLGTTVYIK